MNVQLSLSISILSEVLGSFKEVIPPQSLCLHFSHTPLSHTLLGLLDWYFTVDLGVPDGALHTSRTY